MLLGKLQQATIFFDRSEKCIDTHQQAVVTFGKSVRVFSGRHVIGQRDDCRPIGKLSHAQTVRIVRHERIRSARQNFLLTRARRLNFDHSGLFQRLAHDAFHQRADEFGAAVEVQCDRIVERGRERRADDGDGVGDEERGRDDQEIDAQIQPYPSGQHHQRAHRDHLGR